MFHHILRIFVSGVGIFFVHTLRVILFIAIIINRTMGTVINKYNTNTELSLFVPIKYHPIPSFSFTWDEYIYIYIYILSIKRESVFRFKRRVHAILIAILIVLNNMMNILLI